ncbi:MAG: hypothetical protein AB7K09_05930 [Planctomycetota bacterium]
MRILYLYKWLKGRPRFMSYGFHAMRGAGQTVFRVALPRASRWTGRKPDVGDVWRAAVQRVRPDIVYATTDGLALAATNHLADCGVPIAAGLMATLDQTDSFPPEAYRERTDGVICFSHSLKRGLEAIGYSTCQWVRLGTDFSYFPYRSTKGRYVVSIGNDMKRDWPLLDRVAAAMPDVEFRVIGRGPLRFSAANVRYLGDLAFHKSRRHLRDAGCCLVTTSENRYFSGQTTMVNSLACGTRVVARRDDNIEGYEDLGGDFHDADAGADAIADAVRKAISLGAISRDQRAALCQRYDLPAYASGLVRAFERTIVHHRARSAAP